MEFKALASKLALILIMLLSLPGCDAFAPSTPPALPTVVLDNGSAAPQASLSGGVTASGIVAPAQEARLAFALAGEVETVNVRLSDQVQAGQVLAKLAGSEKLTAAVESASLEVLNAQQALKGLQDSAAMVTAQAQQDVAQAQDELDKALRRLRAVENPDLNYYRDRLQDAQNALTDAQQQVVITDIGSLHAALQAARDALDIRNEILGKIKAAIDGCPPDQCDPKRRVQVDQYPPQTLEDAQDAYNDALNRVNELELQIDQAERGNEVAIRDAQKAYDDAKRNLEDAEKVAGGSPNAIRLASAQADVAVAEARLAEAQAYFAKVKDGPDPDQLALAQARLAAAEAQLAAAKSALKDLELRAPFSGTVAELHIHNSEWVAPGQPALLLSDVQHLRVETTDLSERDVPQIEIGQTVTVLIKALNQEVTGRVSEIAPLADTLGGDVVYKTTIDLDAYPSGLRAGMSAEVQFGTEQ